MILRALPDMYRVGFALLVAYRAELTIWVLTASMPLIMLALWNAVAGDAPVAGYDQAALTRYFAATLVVRQLSSAWLVWILSAEIRMGALSKRLLKPIHPLLHYMVNMTSAMPLRIVVLAPILAALMAWRPELLYWPGWGPIALGVVATVLAFWMNFCVQALFGILGFWIDKTEAIFGVWFSVWIVCSGYIAPLAVYPWWAQWGLKLTPFRGMLGLPVELLSGRLGFWTGVLELAVQIGWAVVLGLAVRAAWNTGVKRYGAFGA